MLTTEGSYPALDMADETDLDAVLEADLASLSSDEIWDEKDEEALAWYDEALAAADAVMDARDEAACCDADEAERLASLAAEVALLEMDEGS